MSDAIRRPKARRVLTMKDIVIPPPSPIDRPNGDGNDQTLLISKHASAETEPHTSGLHGISLRIDSATFHAVLTDHHTPLLRFIARLASADSGQIRWRHTLTQRLRGDVIPVAYVPAATLTPSLSVEEDLLSTLAFAGAHIDADQYQSLLRALQITSLLPQQTHTLTQAQGLRVTIARSLLLGARILLLDEPTSGLSDQEAEGLLNAVKTLCDQGYTVVAQTRSPDVAALADRVFLLIGGELLGTLDSPDPSTLRSEYTAAVQTSIVFNHAHSRHALPLTTSAAVNSEDVESVPSLEENPEFEEDTRPVWQPTRASQSPAFTPLPSASLPTPELAGTPLAVQDSLANVTSQDTIKLDSFSLPSGEGTHLPSLPPAQPPEETVSFAFPSAYVQHDSEVPPESTLHTDPLAMEMEEMYPSTTSLPLIPRPKSQTIDADSEDVIARAQNILKDLPGSVLPPTPPQD